jgi:SAM-dependent methyltransferase
VDVRIGFPPSFPIEQRDTPELLDSRSFSRAEVTRSLNDVARINSFLGAANPLYRSVWTMIERAQLQRATVLDVGCGNGDFARRLVSQSRQRGFDLRVVALDISPLHLEIAREMTPPDFPIEFIEADAFALPLRDLGADIVTSTLFLHHFRPLQLQALLGECSRVARVGWAMNDCTRDGAALLSFRVLRPFLARSFLTRFDAPASIWRAYTVKEMRGLSALIPGARVRELFPYRLQVQWTRKEATSILTSPSSARG